MVNGREVSITVGATTTLLDVLRDKLGIMSPKRGCSTGDCGACTVLVDGKPRKSCITLALTVSGKEITTLEGIGSSSSLHPLQTSFVNAGATQCGFCSPGMILSAKALLDRVVSPTREEIIEAISGNLCRCTGYVKIIDAILMAADELRSEASEQPRGSNG